MKYFVLRGLLPTLPDGSSGIGGRISDSYDEGISAWRHFHPDEPIPKQGEQCFLNIRGIGRISVFVHNVFDTLILITSRSQERAYLLASPLRAFATIFLGSSPDDDSPYEYLVELTHKPQPTQTRTEIARLYRPIWFDDTSDPQSLGAALGSGTFLARDQLKLACRFVDGVHLRSMLRLCLLHLERSHHLYAGYMSDSYYYFHYRHERAALSPYAQRKGYLEERTRYDLAFLSAFRAIEAFLDTTMLRKRDIAELLRQTDIRDGTSFLSGRWRSRHEVFTSGRKWWSFSELIGHYLDIRNAVAAHANPKPPFRLNVDQVREIQELVADMLYAAVLGQSSEDTQEL